MLVEVSEVEPIRVEPGIGRSDLALHAADQYALFFLTDVGA